MSYKENFKQQLNSLKEQIKTCKDEEFNSLVYQYNFYQLVINTLENEMIEIDKYKNILENENFLPKLYRKFMGWINAPSILDETVLEEFLIEIETEERNEPINLKLIDKIVGIFFDYYTQNDSQNTLKKRMIEEISKNKIPYKVLQHLYNLYEDSQPRCEQQYIEKIKNVLYEAEDYYFGNEYSRETIKCLIYQDTYLAAYKEYKELKKIIEKLNNSNEKEREKIVNDTLRINYSQFKKEEYNHIYNESSTMVITKNADGKLGLDELIDIYNEQQLIEGSIKLNKFLNIVEDIMIFKDIEKLEDLNSKDQANILNKIQHLKMGFKEFKMLNEAEEMEEESI